MDATCSFTILFEDPFWIGLYARMEGTEYNVCKITFGAEPKECEIYAFLLQNFNSLRFSPTVKADMVSEKRKNPKRLQREIKEMLLDARIGTKAQQALKLQHEEGKVSRKIKRKRQEQAEQERLFALRQKKKKAKHRGK